VSAPESADLSNNLKRQLVIGKSLSQRTLVCHMHPCKHSFSDLRGRNGVEVL
jgi:hypothetical protein